MPQKKLLSSLKKEMENEIFVTSKKILTNFSMIDQLIRNVSTILSSLSISIKDVLLNAIKTELINQLINLV